MAEKVLLIDDEKEFLDALSERLESRGMEVSTCTSATDAVELSKKVSFDAIVLDLQMPGMDGIETLKALKENRPEVQIILLTGHATVEKGIEAMKLGAMDFLEKPADISTLTDKIKKAQAKKMILVEKRDQEKIERIILGKGF